MCIFIATTAHPKYAFIGLSNRDEYLDRPTSDAGFFPEPYDNVLAPCDLFKEERGTWIGITKEGRFAALLNYFEETLDECGQFSRGAFTKRFLMSHEEPKSWVEREYEDNKQTLEKTGGFTMICGDLHNAKDLMLFSNRGDEGPVFQEPTVCVSNSHVHQPWPKAELGKKLLQDLISKDDGWSEETLVKELLQLLHTDTFPRENISRESVRHSVYIPPVNPGRSYGTRTSTVILMDHEGNVQYIERTLDTNKTSDFSFNIMH